MRPANLLLAVVLASGLTAPAAAQTAPTADALTLPQLEQFALAHNPTLRQAADQVAAAAGRARQAGMWPNPTVGYEGAEIRGGAFRGGEQGAFVQQMVVLGGKLRAAQQVAAAGERQQHALAGAQRQAVLTAVRLIFYDTLAVQQTVQLDEKLLDIAEDAAHTTDQLANVGQADRPDQLQAEVEAEQAQVALTDAQQRQSQDWAQLAATVGQPALPPSPLAGSLTQLPPLIDTERYLTELLTTSPAVRVAEAGVTRAQAELRGERKQPIPNLQLRGGLESNRELDELTRRPVGWQGFATVGIQLPIFNRNQGNIQAGVAELDRARQELERVRLELRARAAPDLADYRSALASVALYRSSMLPKAQQAYEMYLKSYRGMAAAYPQVLVAQRTWFQLQTAYIATLDRLWRAATTLQGFLLTDGL